jgi:hypothetical protein
VLLHRHFEEEQVFRIDHYLGKEAVQNLLALRFANAVFEPLWNANAIEQVQITVAETVGVEGRWPFYDSTGAHHDHSVAVATAQGEPAGLPVVGEELDQLGELDVLQPAHEAHRRTPGLGHGFFATGT